MEQTQWSAVDLMISALGKSCHQDPSFANWMMECITEIIWGLSLFSVLPSTLKIPGSVDGGLPVEIRSLAG